MVHTSPPVGGSWSKSGDREEKGVTLKGSSEEMLAFCHFSYLYCPCAFIYSLHTDPAEEEREGP